VSTNLTSNNLGKHEAFVEQQLAAARGRIRALDLLGLLLLLACVTLGYALLMGLADRFWQLPSWLRLGAFLVYAAAGLYLAGLCVYRVTFLRVNPYYAARRLEEVVPDAKNSVVNWLDLRDEPMPAAIRHSLGLRAAKDIAQADPEKAIANRRTAVLGSIAGGLACGVAIAFLWWGPGTFVSLLQRSFAPFSEIAIAARTNLELLQPDGGDLLVLVNQKVEFRARVTGRVPRPNQPDSVKLHYRYNPTDPFVEQPLDQDPEGDWVTSLLGDQVHNGFWYKITAGDAATPEYQVKVRSLAQVMKFDATYKFRPYLRQKELAVSYPNEVSAQPHLKAHRGTEVTFMAHTNRTLKEGRIEFELKGEKTVQTGEVLKDDPKSVRYQFLLTEPGTYRLLFTSAEGEPNSDRFAYHLEVLDDRAPVVQLTVPGKDVTLPANGTLNLEGKADDDHGIKSLSLQMRVLKGESQPELASKEYRPGKSLELKGGRYPEQLDYRDFVALEKIKTKSGEAFAPAPGTELEYWLVAVDNCDFPDPKGNVGSSAKYKVTIAPPQKDQQKQKQERQKAEEQQKQHEKKQDQDLQKQSEKTDQEQKKADDGQGNGKTGQSNSAQGDKKGPDQPEAKGSKEGGDGQPKSPLSEQELQKRKDQLKNELQKENDRQQAREKQGQGETKPDDSAKGESKQGPNPESKPGAAKPNEGGTKGQKEAEKKERGSTKGEEGQCKNQGQSEGQQGADGQAQAKDGGKSGQSGREGSVKSDERKEGSNKSAAKQPSQGSEGSAKEGGKEDGSAKPAASKDAGKGDQTQTAKEKAPGQLKEQPTKTERGSNKTEGDPQSAKAPKGQGKDGGASNKTAKAEEKKGPNGSGQPTAQAKDDPNAKKGSGQGDRKELNREEFDKLKEQLRSGDFKERDKAADELSKQREQTRDAQTRKEIEKELKEAGRDPKQGTEVAHTKEKSDAGQQAGKPGTEKNAGSSRQSPKEAAGAKSAKPESGSSAGTSRDKGKNDIENAQVKDRAGYGGKGTAGEEDEPALTENNPDFAKRAGDLQLEDLKKVTPEMLKKLNWSEKDWRDFRTAFEAKRRQEQQHTAKPGSNPDKLQYGGGIFGQQGARKLQQNPQGKGGADLAPTHAPPGFEEAQRIFTSVPLETRRPSEKK
jgi:hypothetical protein